SKYELEQRLSGLDTRLGRGARYQVLSARQRLSRLAQSGAFARMQDLVARRQQRVDELVYRLAAAQERQIRALRQRIELAAVRLRHQELRNRLSLMRRELEARLEALANATRHQLERRAARLHHLAGQLQALSPLGILERGYALIFDEQGKLVTRADQLSLGDAIRARVARGQFKARVEETEP
ncbi:MAG: exodeoxyribonuclease VII large subunit, partial [Candidatus Korobacteraceae bacterium]